MANLSLHPHQRALWRLIVADGQARRGAALVGGLGSGKTTIGAALAIQQALANAAVHQADGRTPAVAVGVPSFSQARGGSFAAVVKMLRQRGWSFRERFSSGVCDVRFGGTAIQWVSAEHPQAVEGWEPAGFWIDEPDSCAKWADLGLTTMNLWLGRLRNKAAPSLRYWLTGTPKGLQRLWELQHGDGGHGQDPLPDLAGIVRARTEDNTDNAGGYAEQLRKQFSGKLAKAMLDGEFVDLTEGQAYELFSRVAHVRPCEYNSTVPMILTWDFNRNPMHVLACQRTRDKDSSAILQVLREFVIRETTTESAAYACAEWLRSLGHKRGVEVYGDPSGLGRTTHSARSDYELMRPQLQANFGPYSELYRSSHTTQIERVNAVNGALRDGLIAIDPGCQTLIQDLIQVAFKPGTAQLDKRNPALTHASDALGYCVQQIFPGGAIRRVAKP